MVRHGPQQKGGKEGGSLGNLDQARLRRGGRGQPPHHSPTTLRSINSPVQPFPHTHMETWKPRWCPVPLYRGRYMYTVHLMSDSKPTGRRRGRGLHGMYPTIPYHTFASLVCVPSWSLKTRSCRPGAILLSITPPKFLVTDWSMAHRLTVRASIEREGGPFHWQAARFPVSEGQGSSAARRSRGLSQRAQRQNVSWYHLRAATLYLRCHPGNGEGGPVTNPSTRRGKVSKGELHEHSRLLHPSIHLRRTQCPPTNHSSHPNCLSTPHNNVLNINPRTRGHTQCLCRLVALCGSYPNGDIRIVHICPQWSDRGLDHSYSTKPTYPTTRPATG